MWPFGFGNKYPYTNFHELNADWILDKIRGLEHAMKQFITETTETIVDTVNQWLDDHPEATTSIEDGSVTVPKFASDVQPYIEDTAASYIYDGIEVETGSSDKDIYTVIKIPKSKYKIDFKSVSDDPADANTIKNYVIKNNPFLAINVSNSANFVYNDTLYGSNYTINENASIIAKKDTDEDLTVFENGTDLASLLYLGYSAASLSWNCLRLNGENKNVDYTFSTYATPNPRQTLAWDDDYFYVYSSYARLSLFSDTSASNKIGLTMQEVLAFCTNKGWPNVVALDGGGSVYTAAGKPYRDFSINVNDGYWRDCHLCIVFEEKE